MEELKNRFSTILKQLKTANNELLSLADDIWLSIDHNNNEALKKGVAFKTAYNDKVADLENLQSDISKLIEDFVGEPSIEIDYRKIIKKPIQRTVREKEAHSLDNRVKHYLDEDFTDKVPAGFVIRETHFKNANSWRSLYLTTLDYLHDNFGNLQDLLTSKRFITKRGRKMFSRNPKDLRRSIEIKPGIHAEVNLSANQIRNYIKLLLNYFKISINDFVIYLRMERK